MSQTNNDFNPFDPTGMFKTMRDAQMDAWSKMMIQLVNTDAYAQANAQMLDAWLTTSVPFRKAFEMSMTQALVSANMPTRADVKREFQHALNVERQSAIMERWAREHCYQRCQVDSAIWYECWHKQAIA